MADEEGPIPGSLIVPGCVEVVAHAMRYGNERCNVVHYQYTGAAPNESELATLAQEYETTVIEEQEDWTANDTNWYKITVRDLASLTGAFHERRVLRLGVAGFDVTPWQTAVCLSKRTGQRGRSNHGRFYLFDIARSQVTNDDVILAAISPIGDIAARLLEPRVGGRFLPCVMSRKNRTTKRITSITWDYIVDSQRRRKEGRGA